MTESLRKKQEVIVFNAVYDKEVMAEIVSEYHLYRLDLASEKTAFLAEHGLKCRALIINGHTELTSAELDLMPNLELVVCSSAGYEYMDIATLKNRNIQLTNTAAALNEDVADMAILMMLASMRDLVRAHDYVATGKWAEQGMFALQSSLKGKNLGLVGFGKIGQAIASRASVFGLNIAYHSRSEKADTAYSYYSDLHSMASWADILVVVVPGGNDTENLINQDIMEKLGPKGVLVNLSRGSVVDEQALIRTLKAKKLGHASLDVYLNEPRPNKNLTSLDCVTLYPHHASGTAETRHRMSRLVIENLNAFYEGNPLITPVF